MKKTYLLGIDNGTTTTKATLFDLDGNEVAVSSGRDVKTAHPEPGWAEQSMEEIWQATASAIRNCLERAAVDALDIAGVSLSGHGGGVWLVDESGAPVRPAIIWLDGRAKPYLDRWGEQGLLPQLYDLSGWNLFAGMGPVTIFPWLMDHEPESLKKAYVNLTSKDWTKYCLTGEFSTDPSMASVALIDFRTLDYSDELLTLAGIGAYRHLLPKLAPAWEVAGKVTRQAAEMTGLKEGTPVSSGAFDGACSTLGAGAYNVGEACSNIATAGVHVVLSAEPTLDSERIYSLMCHTVPGVFYKTSMAQVAAGNLDWAEREFCATERQEAQERGVSVYEVINEKIRDIPVGSGGIVYLPLLQGERAPFVKPEARGVFFGLGDWHTRAHLLRSVFEGVALSTRHNIEAMIKKGRLDTIYVSGGGSKSPLWCQIIADCTGSKVRVPAGADSGSRGAAINAGVAVGAFKDHGEGVRRMVNISREYEPNPENVKRYDQLYQIYIHLIQAVWPVWEESAEAGIEHWQ
ncbi:MAG: carbohydrate kinase [Anaerolineae bacterium]|nr:carbohydrate kinase [Anaerolineae bacterium]